MGLVDAELDTRTNPRGRTPSNLFREVNERIRDVHAAVDAAAVREFICECRERDCLDVVRLAVAEYDALRAAGAGVLAPRHHLNGSDNGRPGRVARRPA